MSGQGDLENFIISTVERVLAGRRSERHGLVTSWDPDKHLAKVAYMPDGQESGWLPVETGHIGNGYGIMIGLTPGDGKTTGDQVIVRFQEGDFESGKIVQRVHSDMEKAPRCESGEILIWHGEGAKISFKKGGSLTVQDGNGASHVYDGHGNLTANANNKTDNFGGDRTATIGGKRTDTVSGPWKAEAKFGLWKWLTAKDDMSD